MRSHFQLLASSPSSNLPEAMAYFMRETSREIVRRAGRINQTWKGPYFRCLLKTEAHFLNAYKFVYRKPVAAGLVHRCEEYAFSSLRGLLGFEKSFIPMEYDALLFRPDLDVPRLEWLNTADNGDQLEIGKALRKSVFCFQKVNQKYARPPDFVF